MRKSQNFWDKNAGRYDRFMRKDAAAYERLYELLRPVVRHRTVLELAAGTGLIAKNIVNSAAHIEATDASPEMIAEAKRDNRSAKLAVVDGKQRPTGHIGAVVPGHVEVVEAEHNAGEHIIDGHGPFAALVLELPHGAAVLLGQKLRPLRRERAATQARTGFFHTDRLLSLTIPCG